MIVVVSAFGEVFSELSSGTTGAVHVDDMNTYTYRILAIGGSPDARARILVTAYGQTASYPITQNGPLTVAIVRS